MMDGDMDGKAREIQRGKEDKKTVDLQRKLKEELGIDAEIAGRGCLRMTAGEAARVMEWIDRS